MPEKARIALDVMGGDHGASVVLPGADISLARHPDIEFLLYGNRAMVEPLLDRMVGPAARTTAAGPQGVFELGYIEVG